MELKSLFIGIFFSMGIFAIKNGVGLHYFLAKKSIQKQKSLCFFFILKVQGLGERLGIACGLEDETMVYVSE